jgi:hypothetical protein
MIPPPSQITVGVGNQIALLIFYSSNLVTLRKVIDPPVYVRDIIGPTLNFKFINCSSQIFFLFVTEMLLASRRALFRLSTILWFRSYNHCMLACFM